MIIYKAEASAGLQDKIQNTTMAYSMPLIKWEPDDTVKASINNININGELRSIASEYDKDLYFTKSILVTTNWNKNTDVFDRSETWAARHTPTHKPTNIEHEEKQLIGHITNCFAMNLDGIIIPDNSLVDELPDIYHLVNGAVIYRGWKDDKLSTMANTLIEEIEAGKKYVSMECYFTNFSYALLDSDGHSHIVARDENSAWLTKHLRAYGGDGEYDGYKIGRLLRNITFSGKAYVNAPANPDSIIFNNKSLFNFSAASKENPFICNNGVYLNRIKSEGKEIILMNEELDKVKASLNDMTQAKANLETENTTIKSEKAKADSRIVDLEKDLVSTKAKIEEDKQTIADITTKLTAAETIVADLTKKISDMTQAQVTASRIAILVEGGIEKTIAEKKVATYANLNDEQFTDLSADLVEAAKKKVEEKPKTTCKATETVDETVLDTAKVETELNLTKATETVDETETLRTELRQAIASQLGININTKEQE